jgi:hypothetical protein
LQKAPGVAESLDWALALMSLHRDCLDADTLEKTLGCVLKVHEDRDIVVAHHDEVERTLGAAPPGDADLATDFGLGSVSTPGL